MRRQNRHRIQTSWGLVGGLKGTWKNNHWQESEKRAITAIESLGFTNVNRLDYFPTCPFDIRATKSNSKEVCVFAVTCRTHVQDLKRHIRLADDLLLDFYVLYMKPDLSGFVFKHSKKKGVHELNMRDLSEVIELK